MVTKTIAVLANSMKRSDRCLAGKEVVREGSKWRGGDWIRPVSSDGGGAVSVAFMMRGLGHDPELLEIIEIPFEGEAPLPDQPENWLLKKPATAGLWKSVGILSWAELQQLVDYPAKLWNDECGPRRVKEGYPREMDEPASLYLIKPRKIEVIRVGTDSSPFTQSGTKKFRVATINYAGVVHDLDIDDPRFAERYYATFPTLRNPTKIIRLVNPEETILCVSLTLAFRGHHYKIAAAFLEPTK